jgi:WD40 repeat protein
MTGYWKMIGWICALAAFSAVVTARAADKPDAEPAAPVIAIAELKRDQPVDFAADLLPIFRKSCLACHNATDSKGELVLETPATILKGSEDGPVVVPGKSGESLLLKVASRQEKPFMPPRNNKVNAEPLKPDELGLIKLWIDQGATGVVATASGPVEWQPLPPGFNPINAVAVTPDGQFAACGRANQIFIYHVPSGQFVTRLTDPELLKTGYSDKPGVADRDLIQSLAFSPDGTLLASGGYRVVKLWRRQPVTPKLNLTAGLAQGLTSLAASPDGKWIAAGSADHGVKLWDASTGNLAKEFSGHTGAVTSLKFSSDSRRLLSGSTDKTIRVWAVAERQLLAQVDTGGEVNAVTWAPGDQQIVSGGADEEVRVWQLPEGTAGDLKRVAELKGHSGAITALETVPGGILSGSADGTIRLWNLEEGKQIRQMDHGGPVRAVAVRPDGKRFASAGSNNTAKLWNADDGKLLAELKGERHAQEAVARADRSVTFAKNEVAYQKTTLETAKKQQQTEVEAVKKATDAKAAADKTFAEKQETQKKAAETKATADKALAAAGAASRIAGKNKELAEKLASLADTQAKTASDQTEQAKSALQRASETKTAAYRAALDLGADAKTAAEQAAQAKAAAEKEPDNKSLAEARTTAEKLAADKTAAAEAAFERAIAAKLALDQAESAKARADQAAGDAASIIKTAGDAKSAAETALADATKEQKDAESKIKPVEKTLADADQALKKAESARTSAEQTLQSVQASQKKAEEAIDAAKTALATAESEQKKTETHLEAARKNAVELEKPVRALAFSADNLMLVTAGDDQLLHTWGADTGQAFETFKGHTGAVLALAFLGAGRITSGGADKSALVWDTTPAWTLERTIGTGDESSPLADRVLAVNLSPNGKWLATGGGVASRSGEIKIWNVADGSLVRELKEPHSDTVFSLDFSTDNKYLASGGADKFGKVFETQTGKPVRTFEGHTHHVLGVSWKRDGRTLASCGADKVVKIWNFATGEQKKTVADFNKPVTSIHFIEGTNEALVSSGDNQVRIVREDGNNVRTFAGAADFVESAAVTADGRIVVAGGQDSVLRIWNGTNGEVIKNFEPPKSEEATDVSKGKPGE